MRISEALNNVIKDIGRRKEFEHILRNGKIKFFQDKSCGITVAKCDHDGGNFVRVAVAYCGEKDKWNKKHGMYIAAYKLGAGQYILIPKFDGWYGTKGWERVEFIRETI